MQKVYWHVYWFCVRLSIVLRTKWISSYVHTLYMYNFKLEFDEWMNNNLSRMQLISFTSDEEAYKLRVQYVFACLLACLQLVSIKTAIERQIWWRCYFEWLWLCSKWMHTYDMMWCVCVCCHSNIQNDMFMISLKFIPQTKIQIQYGLRSVHAISFHIEKHSIWTSVYLRNNHDWNAVFNDYSDFA